MKHILRQRGQFFSLENLGSDGRYRSDTAILVYLALAKLLIHLLTANNYGFFVDEFYWLAMSKHLDFGYVDVPPLVAYIGAGWRFIFGTSLFAIHILPALAGAVMVFFAGLLARELGGGRFAQGFTALMVLVAPVWLAIDSWFAYDSFDQFGVVILFYLMVRLMKQESPRRWLGLGLMAGLGIMTKLTMIFTAGALVLALLTSPGLEARAHSHASPGRKSFRTPWPWLAAGLAILLCIPYLIWQWVHGWPLITYWHNYAVSPIRPHPAPLQFILELFIYLNPVLFPIALVGLFYLLFHREGRNYRPLCLSFLVLLVFFMFLKIDARMLVSACFPLLAAGAVWLEKIMTGAILAGKGARVGALWLVRVYLGSILISSLLLAPFFFPALPIRVLEKYVAATPKFIAENLGYTEGRLSSILAYRFGWRELVKKVAEVYQRLPEGERKKCVIWAVNYAEAGAIDLLGKEYDLPNAISNHYSYYFWGPDLSYKGLDPQVFIVVGIEHPERYFAEASQDAVLVGGPYVIWWMRYQSIYVCRKPRRPLQAIWPELANFQ